MNSNDNAVMDVTDDRYYVFHTGWDGMSDEEARSVAYDGVSDTLDGAIEFAHDYMENELVSPDEVMSIYHNGVLVYED